MKPKRWTYLFAVAVMVALIVPAVVSADVVRPTLPQATYSSWLGRTQLFLNLGQRSDYTITIHNSTYLSGQYAVSGDYIHFSDADGTSNCTEASSLLAPASVATYRWSLHHGAYWFTVISDNCYARQMLLTAGPWYADR